MYLDAVNYSTEADIEGAAAIERRRREVFDRWRDWHPSEISHHDEICCQTAREWLTAMDFSGLNGAALTSGPRWLRTRYKWGASSFPIYWCEAAESKTLDCGALAAITHEIFTSRGVTTYRVQMVQRFSEDSARQWNRSWGESGGQLDWIDGDLIYHEGNAILVPGSDVHAGIVSHMHAARDPLNTNGNGHKPRGKVINFEMHRPALNCPQTSNGHAAQGSLAGIHLGISIAVWDSSAGWWCDPGLTDGYGSIVALRISGEQVGPVYRWGRHVLRPNEWTEIG
jgi:hypothetical protein